jgi:hypothetical protein
VSYCPKCGKKVPLEYGACPSCGQTLHPCYPAVDLALHRQGSKLIGSRNKFDYSNSFIAIWVAALFVSFGLVSSLIDRYGVLYNLGQGLFVALFTGIVLLLVKWLTVRQTNKKRALNTP